MVGASRHGTHIEVRFRTQGEAAREGYDHVVNALWDGRLEIDRTAQLPSPVTQIYRCKYGFRLKTPRMVAAVPSVTIMLGPFGDVVNFRNGTYYLSWYPSCLRGIATGSASQRWDLDPDPASALRVAQESFAALSSLVSGLTELPRDALEQAAVRGGIIVARGDTDIVDPQSALHRRHEIGIESHGRYHSVDTGKYTMAPLFAREIADRICGAV